MITGYMPPDDLNISKRTHSKRKFSSSLSTKRDLSSRLDFFSIKAGEGSKYKKNDKRNIDGFEAMGLKF